MCFTDENVEGSNFEEDRHFERLLPEDSPYKKAFQRGEPRMKDARIIWTELYIRRGRLTADVSYWIVRYRYKGERSFHLIVKVPWLNCIENIEVVLSLERHSSLGSEDSWFSAAREPTSWKKHNSLRSVHTVTDLVTLVPINSLNSTFYILHWRSKLNLSCKLLVMFTDVTRKLSCICKCVY